MISARRASVFVATVVLTGCSILVSTSGFTGGQASADAATDAVDARGDGPTADAPVVAPVPVATECDAGAETSATCRAVGRCCPSAAPYCRIEHADGGVNVTCAALPGSAKRGDPCVPAAGDCDDGLACGFVWADPTYVCTPLCKGNDDCPRCSNGSCIDVPFCNQRLSPSSPLMQCGTCDPTTSSTAECGGHPCFIPAGDEPPRCDDGHNFGHALGESDSCNIGDDCVASGVCVCKDGGLVGDDCEKLPRGHCYRACAPDAVGRSCGGSTRTCTAVPSTSYAYCR